MQTRWLFPTVLASAILLGTVLHGEYPKLYLILFFLYAACAALTYFLPQDDASEFEIALQTEEGSTLERTADVCGQIERGLKAMRLGGQQAITDTLATIGETSGRVGKAEGDVTLATIYCRLPELGGFWSTLFGQTRRWSQFEVMGLARRLLGYESEVRLEEGLEELVGWLEGQVAVDRVDQASAELSARGLTV